MSKTLKNARRLFIAVALIFSLSTTAFAASIDNTGTGSITISFSEEYQQYIDVGAAICFFRVASISSDAWYTLTSNFEDCDVSSAELNEFGKDASASRELVDAFLPYTLITETGCSLALADCIACVDENYQVSADGLEKGLYLITQPGQSENGKMVPFLVSIPSKDKKGNITYDLEISNAKITFESSSLTIEKVWVGDTEAVRPDSVYVDLYVYGKDTGNDFMLYDTEELSDENDWSCTWFNIDYEDVVFTEPDLPYGYTVSCTQKDEHTFVMTNTYTPDGGSNNEGGISNPDPGGTSPGGTSPTPGTTTPGSTSNPDSIGLSIPVQNTISGAKDDVSEIFEFVLANENGDKIDTVYITGEGSTYFGEITYIEEGTYTYTVTETAGSSENWIYDESEWTVTVLVTSNGDTLEAEVSYLKDGESVDSEEGIVFNNVIACPSGSGSSESSDSDPNPTPSNPSTPETSEEPEPEEPDPEEPDTPDGGNSESNDPTPTPSNPSTPTTPTSADSIATAALTSVSDSDYSIQSDTEFPYAGGTGTIIFYVVGSILMVGAVALLITKKYINSTRQKEGEKNE